MKVYLIRHGETKGNAERRYVGTTDEELSESGRAQLEEIFRQRQEKYLTDPWKDFFCPDRIYVSPMKRCRQTAAFFYPGRPQVVVEDLRECSFGAFEYKNYQELQGNQAYQRWIDQKGKEGFPEGESRADFQRRTVRAFAAAIRECFRERLSSAAFVVHGGTLMAVLERYALPRKDYYHWQVKNGEGFCASVLEEGNTFYFKDIKKL